MNRLITSVENFRELGNLKTVDGKRIKKGYFYRSGALDKISEKDKAIFESLGISKVFDFRDKSEIEKHPDFQGNFTYINCPALKSKNDEFALPTDQKSFLVTVSRGEMTKAKRIFAESYEAMPFDNDAYRQLMWSLNDKKPILFHCASGKDRTGLGGAFISLALGVDRKTVMKNYLLSNKYRRLDNAKLIFGASLKIKNKDAISLLKYITYTRKEFLNRALDAIDEKYGDFSSYLLNEFGIDNNTVMEWRKFYLE